jgi:hypothetical protein
MRGLLVAAIVGAGGALACGALGAPLVLAPGAAGAGDAPVLRCDADGFTVGYTTSRGQVVAVTVGGIADPACEGGVLRATVTDAGGAGIASGGPQVVPADGDTLDDSVTLATSPQPAAGLVAGIGIVVEGP